MEFFVSYQFVLISIQFWFLIFKIFNHHMKKHKNFLFIFLLLLSSCEIDRTKLMWLKKAHYNDTITSFLIREDGRQVAFIGKKYHYILDDNSEIIRSLLTWEGRSKLTTNVSDFDVGLTNSVELDVQIYTISTNLTPEESEFLRKLGFSEKKQIFRKNINLSGKRYLLDPNANYDIPSSLDKKISIYVGYTSYPQFILKASLTPITVTSDTVSIVTAAGLTYGLFIAPQVILYPACVFMKDGACKHNPFKLDMR